MAVDDLEHLEQLPGEIFPGLAPGPAQAENDLVLTIPFEAFRNEGPAGDLHVERLDFMRVYCHVQLSRNDFGPMGQRGFLLGSGQG